MDIREVKTFCLLLDKEEAKKIDACLGYCNHRLNNHKASGLIPAGVKTADVTYFRSKFKEMLEML